MIGGISNWQGALPLVAFWVVAVNAATFFVWWHDKHSAIRGHRRVPENQLLLLCLLGGTPAGFLGRRWFRHKTRKQPFVALLWTVAVFQIVGLGAWLWIGARGL